ncbi:MAG: Crp/Fnr family transcriptional regulator [Chitinophagaceae bacterium]|nr:Crp/Fnr family transcriptional regulator [Chitinophagaceae bacterium]
MIDNVFKEFLNRIYPLSDRDIEVLQEAFEPGQIDKKGFLLKEGQVTNQLFFIKSGIYRGYYVKDIDEITVNFYFGPTLYADIASIFDKVPTKYNMQAWEGGEVWFGDLRKIEALGQEYPSILRLFLRFYEVIYTFVQKRQLSFIFDSAEERYLKLFNERPKVIHNMPLAYIASYLGIKPESLSRIRKKISHS